MGLIEALIKKLQLSTVTAVYCAYPGVYGGDLSRTIVDRVVVSDQDTYGSARLGFVDCYHNTSAHEHIQNTPSHEHAKINHGFNKDDRVLCYPGKVYRLNPRNRHPSRKYATKYQV